MFVEFIGLPGSGKSTLIEKTIRMSASNGTPFVKLSQRANARVAQLKAKRGYIRRRPDRSWFYGTFMFAHEHPELFRIAFENTLLNMPGRLDFLDLLGQYHFAKNAPASGEPVLVDEGLLHRGAAAFLFEDCYSSLEKYLSEIPICDAIVHIEMDTMTAIERCKSRPKGLPKLYSGYGDPKLVSTYDRLKELHQTCLDHQITAGAACITLDGRATLDDNARTLVTEIARLRHKQTPEGEDND